MTVSGWARAILLVAALKIVTGLTGFVSGVPTSVGDPSALIPLGVHVVHLLVFGAAGGMLIVASRNDRRAVNLGGAFLLIASTFSDRLIHGASDVPLLAPVTGILMGLRVDSFLPLFIWLFVRDFPRAYTFRFLSLVPTVMIRASAVTGGILFAINLLPTLLQGAAVDLRWFAWLDRTAAASQYWTVLFGLMLPVVPMIVWKARRSPLEERRRAGLLITGLVVGMGPLVLEVLLEAMIPPYAKLMSRSPGIVVGGLILYPLFLSFPIVTTYAVLVQRVLDVGRILRTALHYALARYTVMATAMIPFGGLVWYVYANRHRTVADLVSGPGAVILAAAGVVGLTAIRFRQAALAVIDRRFFREHYDSQRTLIRLVDCSRYAESPAELSTLLVAEIGRALHLDSCAVLVFDPATARFVSPDRRVRSLRAGSPLVTLVTERPGPIDVDLAQAHSPFRQCNEDERRWLVEGTFALLVPLVGSDGSPLGLMALGEKKSELPFSDDDRTLLEAVATSAALAIENQLLRTPTPRGAMTVSPSGVSPTLAGATPETSELAAECRDCGRLQPPGEPTCVTCGDRLVTANVPCVLLGKFRFEERVGSGGMGVVYRAVDLALGRDVAIKTLPRMSIDYSSRLRREARAMALVSHPNLAMIYGAETWRGTPMLIFEFLDGGTLADRTALQLLRTGEIVDLGIALAGALEQTHAAGILHRDIKPSNIGYTIESVPKLLDFGLAKIVDDSRRRGALSGTTTVARSEDVTRTDSVPGFVSSTDTGGIVGTPLYVSPEAILEERPSPGFDLWSLAIVLYESIAGTNPFRGDSLQETFRRIVRGRIPDVREFRPDCQEAIAMFLKDSLSRSRARRPASAKEFRTRLECVKEVALT